jgi:hypothetical protein
MLLLERAPREGGTRISTAPSWASALGAGMAVAAPHAEAVAESVADTVRELRETTDRTPRRVPALSVLAAAVGALATIIALPWRRRRERSPDETTRADRRRVA